MKSSFHIATIYGIPIGISYSWLVIFALVTTSLAGHYFPSRHPDWSVTLNWVIGLATSVLFFLSVVVHELAHSVVSVAQGIPVRSITLFIFGGLANISSEPKRARDEFFMALAGPASSLALAVLFGVVSWLTAPVSDPISSLTRWLGGINLTLAVFNLIPGFPLDGGRVLRAVVWGFTDNEMTATRVAAVLGQMIAYAFIFFGIFLVFRGNFDGLWLAFIGWFLENAATQSYRQVALREALRGVKAGDFMNRECAHVRDDLPVSEFVHDYILPQGRRCYLITDGGRLNGMVTMHAVKEVPKDKWDVTYVRDIMTPLDNVKRVSVDDDAIRVLEIMDQEDVNQVPVMDGDRLVGLIGRDTMLHFIRTRSELGLD